MADIEVTAGEVLEIGNLFYVKQMKAYRTTDARQVPRGVASKHYDIGDVIDICIIAAILTGGIGDPDELIGHAGEDLIAGGIIEQRANGLWYNKQGIGTNKLICRFFIGEDLTPTDEPNNRCSKDGGNCNDPTDPCMCHYQDDNY